ncbi:ABC transporter ATP-binding protein [Janibacter indicus]|uniref:ABC-type quaternary amine transporter n=1 Tax=Janibacter indicus TaxID=857417 RepID=A0A1W1YSQ4_9MICO|nr:ATP-binding cassette domain-containing protein [Janibacter indicus]SMC39166.1 osmoprotectant transport system ATP-binding protein [Janibacter indicus]
MIRLDGVTKQYPDGTVAVDDLSLTAPDRAITVLVGPSGCGKTTTLRMINRMIEPTAGSVTIDGQDVLAMDAAQLRRGIGYVIQHGGLFPHHTVERNVAAVPLLLGTAKKTAISRARELLELVGLDPALGRRYPSQLSGGQQQRVGVARALAADPPVMLMDEPFSAVDPVVREQLQDEFLRLQGELGKTIVMVTHDIDEAIKLGDHVAVLRVGGRIAQLARPHELLAHPADGFVADFLGRDRGYRALGFERASIPLHDEPTVALGSGVGDAAARAGNDGWVLVIDDRRRPQGWARPADLGDGVVDKTSLALGGTLARVDGPLRAALDAALSSPSRRGVVVDGDGALAGTCRATEVLSVIEAQERPHDPGGATP